MAGGLRPQAYVHNPLEWVDPLGLAGCSTKLGKNMEADGVVRPDKTAAHHIVPGADKNGMTDAQKILKKHGIDIDSADNGVFLPTHKNTDMSVPGIKHSGKHPNDYIDAVNKRISGADEIGGKQGVLNELSSMRNELQLASRTDSWYTIF